MFTKEYIDKYVKLASTLGYLYLLKPEADSNIIYDEIIGSNHSVSIMLKEYIATDWGYIHEIGITKSKTSYPVNINLLEFIWAENWKDLSVKVNDYLKEHNLNSSEVSIIQDHGLNSFTLRLDRKETDEEVKARLELFEKYLPYAIKNKEREEREVYEKLKSKFG